jgi:antitoxin (DNA-binding transcriptional repressor) of toxin-antitoxin stability system
MHRIAVTDAERDFAKLIDHVYSEGISVELARGDKVVARITPVCPQSMLKVHRLNEFLQSLPKLDDDIDAFADDVRAIRREFPAGASLRG